MTPEVQAARAAVITAWHEARLPRGVQFEDLLDALIEATKLAFVGTKPEAGKDAADPLQAHRPADS